MTPDDKRRAIAERRRRPGKKIDRSAFLYMVDHDGDPQIFAQCADCCFFAPDKRCAVLGIHVEAGWSCGLFVDGKYDGTPVKKRATVEEAGVYKGQVRCENCRYGHAGRCALYERLNREMPADFDLDPRIDPKGCCNAFSP